MIELGVTPAPRTRVEARVPGTRSKFEGLLGPRNDPDNDFFR